eukprot:Ihof_evm22s24 gene=Ihof_evmTU22s24
MAGRRTRKQTTGKKVAVSAAHYVGYVDDEESVDSIMKKFEELQRFQEQIKLAPSQPEGEEAQEAVEETLTQQQLEEVFKRTSMFSARLLTGEHAAATEDMMWDDEEAWRADLFLRDRDDDGEVSWSSDDELWDEEDLFETDHRRKSHKRSSSGIPREPKAKRARLNNQHMAMAGNMLAGGQRAAIKKRERFLDPRKPTYVRIPADPLPISWGRIIQPMAVTVSPRPPCSRYMECNVEETNLKQVVGGKALCLLLDPPLLLPGESPAPGRISLKQLESMALHRLVDTGFIFIWVEKELVPDVFALMNKWEFRYVENICWMQKGVDNRLVLRNSKYIPKAKLTCFIFRKVGTCLKPGDVELRHQRNPDVVTDYIPPRDLQAIAGYRKYHRPDFIYDVIETLLPEARCTCAAKDHAGRLVE